MTNYKVIYMKDYSQTRGTQHMLLLFVPPSSPSFPTLSLLFWLAGLENVSWSCLEEVGDLT